MLFVGVAHTFNTSPSLHVIGANPFRIGVSMAEYSDEGAACSNQNPFDSNLDDSIVVSGDQVDLKVSGTYIVKYFCKDRYTSATATRIVEVDKR